MLTAYLKQIQIGLALLFLLGTAWGVWKLTSDHYEGVIAKEHAAQQELMAVTIRNLLGKVNKAKEKHNEAQILIGSLASFIDGLQSPKLRIQAPRSSGQQACQGTDGETWVALGRINGYTAISPSDRNRITTTYKRCAQLNIDTIELNNSF